MRLQDRVAIVTGAAMGIGEGIAREFAAEGASVVVADINDASAEKATNQLRASGGHAISVYCDVSQEDDVRDLVANTVSEFGHLDVMVNNAGVGVYKSVTDATVEEFDRCLAVNLRGVFLGMKYAAPHLAERTGSVVNVASVHSLQNVGGTAPYAASKGGVAALTRAAAIDLAQDDIRVNAICPGWIDTPLVQGFFDTDPEIRPAVERRQLLGRLGTPRDIGRAAVYLSSADASYVTGTLLCVDSGMTAQLETWS